MVSMLCCAGLIFWIVTLAAVAVLLAFAVYMLVSEYYPGKFNDGINAVRVKYLSFLKMNKVLITIICVFCILLALYLLFVLIRNGRIISKVLPVIKKSF